MTTGYRENIKCLVFPQTKNVVVHVHRQMKLTIVILYKLKLY